MTWIQIVFIVPMWFLWVIAAIFAAGGVLWLVIDLAVSPDFEMSSNMAACALTAAALSLPFAAVTYLLKVWN